MTRPNVHQSIISYVHCPSLGLVYFTMNHDQLQNIPWSDTLHGCLQKQILALATVTQTWANISFAPSCLLLITFEAARDPSSRYVHITFSFTKALWLGN